MSEKRFRVRFEQEDGRGEIVNEKGIELTAREIVDLLNELNEENDILKQQLQTRYIVNKQYEELQRLKKENELLKRKLELESVKRMHYEQKFFQLKAKELGYNE